MTPAQRYTDEEIRDAIAEAGEDVVSEAILSQEAMFAGALRDPHAVDEAMSDLAEQVLRKLPQFREVGHVSLGAWVNGFARFILMERRRQYARQGERMVTYEEGAPLLNSLAKSQQAVTDDDQFFLEMIEMVRDQIMARPGGAQEWEQLITMAGKPQRGRAARERAREELAEMSGLPVEVFGTEAPGRDEEVPELLEQINVAPLLVDRAYAVWCARCGIVGEPRDLGETLQAVRDHRATHTTQEGELS